MQPALTALPMSKLPLDKLRCLLPDTYGRPVAANPCGRPREAALLLLISSPTGSGVRVEGTLGSTRAPALMRYFTASKWLFSAASISGVLWSSEQVSMLAPACEKRDRHSACSHTREETPPGLRQWRRREHRGYVRSVCRLSLRLQSDTSIFCQEELSLLS